MLSSSFDNRAWSTLAEYHLDFELCKLKARAIRRSGESLDFMEMAMVSITRG